jgi:hypothetical protein
MSKRFWIYFALAVAIVAGGWSWSRGHAAAVVLRSEHSEPAAAKMPQQQMVAVTTEGKQFHNPSCRYIHGKPQMMTAGQAVKLGYTPDPRCMRQALPH